MAADPAPPATMAGAPAPSTRDCKVAPTATGAPASLLVESDTVTEGRPANLVVIAPPKTNLSVTDLQFRSTLGLPAAEGNVLQTPVNTLSAQRPSADQVQKFAITEPQSAVIVSAAIPSESFESGLCGACNASP